LARVDAVSLETGGAGHAAMMGRRRAGVKPMSNRAPAEPPAPPKID
jgi:hypothetical protein